MLLLVHGHLAALGKEVGRQIASKETGYGFRRDLTVAFKTPPAFTPLTIREFKKTDINLLTLEKTGRGDMTAVIDRITRMKTIEASVPTHIYAAVAEDDSPCFIQFMISPADNDKLRAYYKGYFLPLQGDELLLEGAFVPGSYRGKGIMGSAMSQIAQRGRTIGARWAITYVKASNLPSVRGRLASGFHPYVRRETTWRALSREVSFSPLSGEEIGELEASWKTGKA